MLIRIDLHTIGLLSQEVAPGSLLRRREQTYACILRDVPFGEGEMVSEVYGINRKCVVDFLAILFEAGVSVRASNILLLCPS